MYELRPTTSSVPVGGNLPAALRLCEAEVPWYVVHTCCHHEARVEERLRKRGVEVYLHHQYLQRGKLVRVVEGSLIGVVGIIRESKTKKRKVVIEVELFKQAVAVELEDEAVEPWS